MQDAKLSDALVTYVWGTGGRSWPSRDPEAVQIRFADDALDLVPRILAIFDLVDGAPPFWQTEDLATATDRIEGLVRDEHPELSDDAIRAIANQYSFTWKQTTSRLAELRAVCGRSVRSGPAMQRLGTLTTWSTNPTQPA
ncbi:hypothetical protein [Jatrophihabitans sp.]|uniref:hypothetical protein n=1 Tax=Jatrophihabitans sp. TaxID=1932789 RepID=UPI0030C6FDE0